jgi:C4-dicarboxylate transporter DctM subunit
MNPTVIGIIGLMVLVLIFLSRLPISLTMILVGLLGFCYLVSVKGGLNLLGQDVLATFMSYSMSVVPLFIFMGNIAHSAGMGRKLYSAGYKWLGPLPGGLAMATIAGCAGFAAACGSLTASVATMSTVALPEMQKYDYDRGLASGSVAAGGTLGVLIPPSVIFILYGIQTEQSIGKLFVAGILPGILLAGLFVTTIYIMCRRNPRLGPVGSTVSLKEKIASLIGTLDMLILFALVMGGLFVGAFTPTEAGAVGALSVLVIALVRRQLTWEGFLKAVMGTMQTTCMVFLLLFGTTIFGQFLAVSQIPTKLAQWLVVLPVPSVIILFGILIIYLIGGCFMGGLAFMILTLPVFFPVAVSLQFDPLWFGVLMVIMVEVGSTTPPVGIAAYIISGISKDISVEVVFKGLLPFLVAFAICLIILIAFPEIALFLPSLMG